MNLDDLQRLVAGGESDKVEFKKTTSQMQQIGKTLCGFLNGAGGAVLIGVTSDGSIHGQLVADGTLRDLAALLQDFEPPPPIRVQRIPLSGTGREVIALEADRREDLRPFTYQGRAFERSSSTVVPMQQLRYEELLLNRTHSRYRWENRVAEGFGLGDLDEEEILRTARLGLSSGRIPEVTSSDPTEVLDRLGLRVGGHLLNAAVVAYGNRLLPGFPQCQLRMARFRGVDKTEFLDQRQLHGNAFRLLEESILFLRRHLPTAGRIQEGLFERADEPLFPFEALREALVNAFCHRDYSSAGGAVNLAVFDDRLEIWSDGTLPFGLTVDDLKRDHTSRPRNPLIAEVFFRRGLVERWGRGTQRIVELCIKAGHPEPEFLEQSASVGVRFIPSGYTPPLRVSHDLTTRQREILQLLAARESTPLRDIREALENPPANRTLQDDLTHLRRLGLIGSGGRGRGATYWLKRI